jgi:transcriptional regulator with XRE-family HTH domain
MDGFGPTLDYFCDQQGVKPHELATLMGVHRNTIGNWKTKGRPPSAEITTKLAQRLNLTEEETNALLMSAQYAPKYPVKELEGNREKQINNYTAEDFKRDVETYTMYIERILRRFKVVGVVPKGREKMADPALNDIFVPIRVAIEEQDTHRQGYSTMINALEKHPHVVLLGGPGSGKSTAMRYLAWSHAVANLSNAPESMWLLREQPVPFRIILRQLSAARVKHPEYDFLTYTSEVLLKQGGCEINQEMFRRLLERRGMLLLFDGIDEVATLAERSQMIEEIENFALNYPGNRIVVTSRPVGYDLARFTGGWFVHADIQTFDNEQIRQFLERWYQYVLGLGASIPQEELEEMKVLYETLTKNERLHKLAENPLLLSVITELHRYEKLPDRRIEIYDECARLLLEKWANIKGTDLRWKDICMGRFDQFACVAFLGMVLHERTQDKLDNKNQKSKENSTDVSGKFLQREIERFIKEQNLITEVTKQRREAERFLALMQEEAGLIVERGKGEDGEELYGFIHQTFQEYFAAMDVYERYAQEDDPEVISEFLREHLHDPHWQEVILLLISKMRRRPATKLLRQIIESKLRSRRSKYDTIVRQDLFFVSECLCEGIVVENDVTESTMEKLREVVETSAFPTQRKKALDYFRKLARAPHYGDLTDKNLRLLLDTSLDISVKTEIATILYESSLKSIEKRTEVAQVFLALAEQDDITPSQSVNVLLALYKSSSEGSQEEYASEKTLLELASSSHDLPVNIYHRLYEGTSKKDNTRKRLAQSLLTVAERSDIAFKQIVQATQPIYHYADVDSQRHKEAQAILFALARRKDISFDRSISLIGTLYHYFCPEGFSLAFQLTSQLVSDPSIPFHVSLKAAQALSNTIYHDYNAESQGDVWPWYDHAKIVDTLVTKAGNSLERLLQSIDCYYLPYSDDVYREQDIARVLELGNEPYVTNDLLIGILKLLQKTDQKYKNNEENVFLKLTQQSHLSVDEVVQLAQVYLSPHKYPLSEKQTYITRLLLEYCQQIEVPNNQMILALTTLYKLAPRSSEQYQQASQKLWHLVRNTNLNAHQYVIALGTLISPHDTGFIERINVLKIAVMHLSAQDIQRLIPSRGYDASRWSTSEISHTPLIIEFLSNNALPKEIHNSLYVTLAGLVPRFNLLTNV